MIYFDNAATTLPKPLEVINAVAKALNTFGNPSRGSYDASLSALRAMFDARQALSKLFNAGDAMRVAFTLNATQALNIAIKGVKGHIITTAAEHNSVLRPLYKRGNYTVLPLDNLGRLDVKSFENVLKKDTEAVVMCHASNLTGNVYDIESAGEFCHKKGLKFIVDGAQTAGMLPVDIKKAKITALCFTGHKSLYGPQGTGGMCLAENYCPSPLAVGGSGSLSFSLEHPSFLPDSLEAGTQNASGIAGLLEGVRYVWQMSGRVYTDADKLAKEFIKETNKIAGVTLYGDVCAQIRTPVVALNIEGFDSGEVAALLWEKHAIAVRAGAHCAPLMHKTLGTEQRGAVRFSFSHFNSGEEIDLAVRALREISTPKRRVL